MEDQRESKTGQAQERQKERRLEGKKKNKEKAKNPTWWRQKDVANEIQFWDFRSLERTNMEPIDPAAAWKELIGTLTHNHVVERQSPSMDSILTVLAQVLTRTIPQEAPTPIVKEYKATCPTPIDLTPPPLVSEKPTQENLIRDSFVLAGLGNSGAYDKLIAAIKSRGSPLNKMNIDEWTTVIHFLHPELTSFARTKLATILSVVV